MISLFQFATLFGLAATTSAAVHELIVGTFGTAFIYTLNFDDETLSLSLARNTTVAASSSWIALNHDKSILYGNIFDSGTPSFVSYTLENATTLTNAKTLAAGGECTSRAIYVVADQNSPYAVYGSYFGSDAGCGTVMSVDETGALEAVIQNYTYFNSSGVHGTALSPDSGFLYSADDTGNTLWTHSIDPATGTVALVTNLTAPSTGADPRHVAVHPNGDYVYVVLEGSSQLAQYAVDESTGVPSLSGELYPLLKDGENATTFWADEVAVSFSGSYLWATNRRRTGSGSGYISAFGLDESGAILKQNFLLPTTTNGGAANSVAPSPFSDRFVALTDSSVGFVEIWELTANGTSASVVAHLDLADGGCCANAVWYS